METTATQLSTEQILTAVNNLSLPDLEKMYERVLRLQAERKTPHVPAEEGPAHAQFARLASRFACAYQ